ncbi:MAG: Asp-tRNA(Asn)/Glu-tRNA(Gln) amidotransferase subunit GatC [Firmicutes bacterium]|nr:Asp-tRNA(Asn)/Glu-tRNA(Gln) amidotransferase subunit GatC [Bacillota bacterium]
MEITKEMVSYTAGLSRIHLEEEETEEMGKALSEFLNYVEALNQLNTEGVEPLAHILLSENVMRQDVVRQSSTVEEIMENIDAKEDGMPVVPRTID